MSRIDPDPGTDPFLAPPLDGEQLALLRRYGQERPTKAGQMLFREGDRAYDFIVVLSGAVSVVDHEAGAVREAGGTGRLERVTVEDLTTSIRRTLATAALFVLIGAEAHTQWLAESIELDSHGFIVTGPDLSGPARTAPAWERLGHDPYLLETSLPGVFAAGDVRSNSVKRAASAVGEGSIAIRFASEHLSRRTSPAATGPPTRP